jgi:hypothetical protein
MGTRLGVGAIVATLICVTTVLSGCVGIPGACPTIDYINSVDVVLSNETASPVVLEVCTHSACSRSDETSMAGSNISVALADDDVWRVTFAAGDPDSLFLKAFDGEGSLLAETRRDIRWTSVDGPGECRGPMQADEIHFSVK